MRVLLPLAVLVLFASCGGDDPAPAADASTPVATATATPRDTSRTDIRDLVSTYYETVASDDPKGTCGTLAPSEQDHFERKFGACEKAFEFSRAAQKAVEGNRAGTIELDGDRAKITVTDYAGDKLPEPLYAIKVDGTWWMARSVAYRRAG